MYILVRSRYAEPVAIAASDSMETLKLEAIKDAYREFGELIDQEWSTDAFFPYILFPQSGVQYYIREIKYL